MINVSQDHRIARTEDAKSEPIDVGNTRVDEDNEEEEGEASCGVGSFRPQWMQNFATARFFAINFCLVGILQGIFCFFPFYIN